MRARAPARAWNAAAITAERDAADRQVDVEDPAPREVVDEEAAEQRADHGRDAEDGAEEALVLPRSRGGTMSPITAIVVTISPPPPIPWSARKAISCAMFCASPHSAEPTRKITIAVWSTILRP